MNTQTIIYIILALFGAFGLSYLHYIFKAKTKRTYVYVLAFLRFLSIFLLLLLLINPVFKTKSNLVEKVHLPVMIDNSASLNYLDPAFAKKDWLSFFKNHDGLNDKFVVDLFTFGNVLQPHPDSLTFTENATQIAKVGQEASQLYRNAYMPLLLVTDGNQTKGADFTYAFNANTQVYPVVVGDTAFVYDAHLVQANANKYVHVKNEFPIEVIAYVATLQNTNVTLEVLENKQRLYSKTFVITPSQNVINQTVMLTANSVGLKKYEVVLKSTLQEKNLQNNTKVLGIEIIDQKSEIALVSSILHPDLGALKRSIEKNEQRKVKIVKPTDLEAIQSATVVLAYQPNPTFLPVFNLVEKQNKNMFVIAGLQTDYVWLNQNQKEYTFNLTKQKEQYAAALTSNFEIFDVPKLNFNALPPLDFPFGNFKTNTTSNVLFNQQNRGFVTQQPLLSYHTNNGTKRVYLLGENIWKWRLESLKESDGVDQLLDKSIQFLAIKNPKQNLVLQMEGLYNQTDDIVITAQFFNKNLELDQSAVLKAKLVNLQDNSTKNIEFTKHTSEFVLALSDLDPGNYKLSVSEQRSKQTVTKNFEILAYNPEKQAINANINGLKQLASQTKGKVYSYHNIENLIQNLIQNPDYSPTQKEITSKHNIISYKWALALLLVLLAAEWFVRKYNGLK